MRKIVNVFILVTGILIVFQSCNKHKDNPKPTTIRPSYQDYLWIQQNINSNDSITMKEDTVYFRYANHHHGDSVSALFLNQPLKGDFEFSLDFKDMKGTDGAFSLGFSNALFLNYAPIPAGAEGIFSLGVDASFSNSYPYYYGDTASLSLSYRSSDYGKMKVKRTGSTIILSISNPDINGNPNWYTKTYNSMYTGDLYCSFSGSADSAFSIKIASITFTDSNTTNSSISIDPKKRYFWELP